MPAKSKAKKEQIGNAEEMSVPTIGPSVPDETIVLNGVESTRFVEALLTPPEPTPALRELMQGPTYPSTHPRSGNPS